MADLPDAGYAIKRGHFQKIAVGAKDPLAQIAPNDRQSHHKGDQHRNPDAPYPKKEQKDYGSDRRGLEKREKMRQKMVKHGKTNC